MHDVVSGRQVASTQVFCDAVVHGLRIQPVPGDSSAALLVLVFGQKSLAVLLYFPAQEKLYVCFVVYCECLVYNCECLVYIKREQERGEMRMLVG